MHELPWITVFGSRVRRFANYFYEWRSHEWKCLANHITNDRKIVLHGNECIILLSLHTILCPERTITRKTITSLMTVPSVSAFLHHNTVDLLRYANAGYWYYDVIFGDCSCTRKLAQKQSSLVNNNRGYRFVTTLYSWLTCKNNSLYSIEFQHQLI